MLTDRFYPGHGQCYEAARQLVTFTEPQLIEATGLRPAVVMQNVRAWVSRDVAERVGEGKSPYTYRLTGKEPVPMPAQEDDDQQKPSVELHLWIACRGLVTFSPTDLVVSATTEDLPIDHEVAKRFCGMLLRGGYLKVMRKARTGTREAIYKLIRDTGPNPPRERRIRGVWDDNIGEFVHLPEVSA